MARVRRRAVAAWGSAGGRRVLLCLTVVGLLQPSGLRAQESGAWFPGRAFMPDLVAGPRDPVTKAQTLLVTDDPTRFGDGPALEVALGVTVPALLLSGSTLRDALVVGIEAVAFARFTLQITERELVATDWVFAVPLIWRRESHWFRLRFYHTSSHLGDEYARRFEESGVNFSRDAADFLAFLQVLPGVGSYAGAGYAYNVHPEESRRWWIRTGAQSTPPPGNVDWLPYWATDVQMEQDNDWDPRVAIQAGVWLPPVGGRRVLRLGIEYLAGPTPLGQFQGGRTAQWSLGLFGNL